MKIAENGQLYATTFRKIYRIDQSGNIAWSYTYPQPFIVPDPAIDIQHNRVFVGRYNPSTHQSYLVMLNATTGAVLDDYSFGTVSNNRGPGRPAIAADGTVYVGNNGMLYALKVNAQNHLQELWHETSFGYPTDRSPTIRPDGLLYFAFRNTPGLSGLEDRVGAFDPATRSFRWVINPGVPLYSYLGGVYAGPNNSLVFTMVRQDVSGGPAKFSVFAYQDNGNSYTKLWEKDFGKSGGQTALGPGNVLYVLPGTGLGNTITALADGSIGDPYGAGMGWLNNSRPNIAENMAPVDGSAVPGTSVTLAWNGSDPEGSQLNYTVFLIEHYGDNVTDYVVAHDIQQNSLTLSGLRPGTLYSWYVRSTDGQAITDGTVWTFETVSRLDGDYDGDGIVHIGDYYKWRAQYGMQVPPGSGADGDGNGNVDAADFVIWRKNTTSDDVHVEGNAIWNNKVYISWQNIKHVSSPDATNMVIDTWRVDDNGDGDPRNDENRIIASARPTAPSANGITATMGVSGGLESGTTASTVRNSDGSVTLVLSDSAANGAIQAKYTVKRADANIYGELVVSPIVASPLHWGVSHLADTADVESPGNVAAYDRASINGEIYDARLTPSPEPSTHGVDYWLHTTNSRSYAALISREKKWTTGMVLTSTPIPVDLRAWLGMNSPSNFPRQAVINLPQGNMLSPGSTYTFHAEFHADKDLSLQGYKLFGASMASAIVEATAESPALASGEEPSVTLRSASEFEGVVYRAESRPAFDGLTSIGLQRTTRPVRRPALAAREDALLAALLDTRDYDIRRDDTIDRTIATADDTLGAADDDTFDVIDEVFELMAVNG